MVRVIDAVSTATGWFAGWLIVPMTFAMAYEVVARYVRGSSGIDYKERIKTMKLLWDAVGSEFGARHEIYEMNYAGSHELVRLFPLQQAQGSGALKEMEALAERCMADYDEDGWKDPAYHSSDDISIVGRIK